MSSFITSLRSFNHATKSMVSSSSISYFIKNSPKMFYPRRLYTTESTITPTSTPETCSRVLYFLKDEESLDQLSDCNTSLERRRLKKRIKQNNKKKLFI